MNEMIASCSEDGTCKVWMTQGEPKAQNWNGQEVPLNRDGREAAVPLWKVSWSEVGNMLAISGGDNKVRIMNQTANG